MNLTTEQIKLIKSANSLDELEQLVKENNIDVNNLQIEKAFNFYHSSNELNDEELNIVNGGAGNSQCSQVGGDMPGCDLFEYKIDVDNTLEPQCQYCAHCTIAGTNDEYSYYCHNNVDRGYVVW